MEAGEVGVFAARTDSAVPGRWVPVARVTAPDVALGADVAGAELIAAPLPGARYALVDVADLQAAEAEHAGHLSDGAAAALAAAEVRLAEQAEADELQESHDAWLVRDALAALVDAVPGHDHVPAPGEASADVEAMVRLAALRGLPADPIRMRRAVADAQVTGRDRITALAAACSASTRRLELAPHWPTSRGPAMLVRVDGTWQVARWGRRGYRVWNPVTGSSERVVPGSSAAQARTGLLLQPLLDPSRPATRRDLFRISTRRAGGSLALILAMTAGVGLLTAVIPVVSGRLTTAVVGMSNVSWWAIAAALVLVVAASAALSAVRLFALVRIRTQALATAAAAVWDRLLRLPMSWHRGKSQNARMTDATAVDQASATVSDGVVTALLDTAVVLGALVGALTVGPAVAVAVFVFLAVRTGIDVALARRSAKLSRALVDRAAQSPVLEMLQGVNRLRASGATSRAFAHWAQYQARRVGDEVRSGHVTTAQATFATLWPSLGLALLLAVIAATSSDTTSAVALGSLVTAQAALTAANAAVGSAVASVGAGLTAAAILRRIGPILDTVPESAGGEVAPVSGGIDVRGVSYRYAEDLPTVLDGLDLEISPGEHVALVGPSGCGKTTLLRLLLGLDDPDSGLVAYDGRDLTALDRSGVRRQIGAVMQSSALLPGSIRDNVDMGRGLTATEVWEALEQAAVADDVRAMPMGLHTVVVEGGATVSGGQRQRILLARALAGHPRILILDEATSALDSVSQAAVVANLDRLDVTRVVVAHRLSTIKRADRIAVMSGGRIVQTGTFAELAAVEGPFRTLVERQSLDPLVAAA